MSTSRIPQLAPTLFITALAACANPRRINEEPITMMRNGDKIESPIKTLDTRTRATNIESVINSIAPHVESE